VHSPRLLLSLQLTHTDDVAGASVFALVSRLDGAYHVCSAPTTLQELFNSLATRKGLPEVRLRGAEADRSHAVVSSNGISIGDAPLNDDSQAQGVAEHGAPPPPTYSTFKLEAAGYELLWP